MTDTERQILCALIGQVAAAAAGQVETRVRTVITRPMWRAFLRSAGLPEDSEPTDWTGSHNTIRVYGSETHVVESDEFWSASTLIR